MGFGRPSSSSGPGPVGACPVGGPGLEGKEVPGRPPPAAIVARPDGSYAPAGTTSS